MKNVDRVILRYKEAYYDYNGRYPEIRKSGSWIRVGGFDRAFRSKELHAMTTRLMDLKRGNDHWSSRDDVWHIDIPKVKSEVKEIKKQIPWRNYVGEDIINMFLDKLFSVCDNSAYTMEKYLKDFALSGKMPMELGSNGDIEYYKNALRNAIVRHKESLKNQNESHSMIIAKKDKIIDGLSKELEALRENSVLFTMEDLTQLKFGTKSRKKLK